MLVNTFQVFTSIYNVFFYLWEAGTFKQCFSLWVHSLVCKFTFGGIKISLKRKVKVKVPIPSKHVQLSQLRSERCVHRLAWFMTIICVWKINLKVDELSVIGLWLNHGSVSLTLQRRLSSAARSFRAQETLDSFSLKVRCSQGLEICRMTFNQAAPVNANLYSTAESSDLKRQKQDAANENKTSGGSIAHIKAWFMIHDSSAFTGNTTPFIWIVCKWRWVQKVS